VIEQSQKSSNSSSKFFLGITTLFVAFMLWMWFAKVDITTQAIGYVVPESNFTSIDTMVDGQVVEVKVKQGDLVKKDDVILIINPGVGYEPYNVTANIDGRIQTLHFKNPGAVVTKGETILLIVPIDQKLIVTGKLFVKDRGYIKVGQSAKIKLANQDQLKFGPIDATIISISPNAVQSEQGTWYEIELELKQQKFTSGTIDYTLVPGIQVQIFILTGERTILSYVTTPFHNSVGQALQER
jgi:multidrug efflux pump subunit AcrA (membrane-fusion protein)|tara:strand:- start:1278 stop:2000 length:723 start_codon:yes stop_codon:yes gene_type:complete